VLVGKLDYTTEHKNENTKDIAVTSDMSKLAMAIHGKILIGTNTSGLSPERVIETGYALNTKVIFHPYYNNFLYSANTNIDSSIGSVQLWDLSSENTELVLEIITVGVVALEVRMEYSEALQSVVEKLYVGLENGNVEAYEVDIFEKSYQKVATYNLPNENDRVTAIGLLYDWENIQTSRLCVGYQKGYIAIFNFEDSHYFKILDVPEQDWFVTSLIVSYMDRRLVASYRHGFIKEWDLDTFEQLETPYEKVEGSVNGLALNNNIYRLFAAIDNDIHVFDRVSGVRLAKLSAHTDWITAFEIGYIWDESEQILNEVVIAASDDMSLSAWVDFDVYGWKKNSGETTEENDFGGYEFTSGENDFGGYEYTTPEE